MTWLNNVNFFIKVIVAFAIMGVAWLSPNLPMSFLLVVVVIGILAVTRVPGFRGYLKGAALLAGLVIISWCLNLMLQGMSWTDALPVATKMATRLIATTGAFYFVMETSTPGSILAACSAARLPPMATLVLSLTFGIIPMLREEFERIGDAQRARGMEIDQVPFFTRLRFALARGVPLLVQAIRMAHAISLALAIYGFDTRQKRTTWRNVGLSVEPRLPFQEKDK